MTVPIPDPAASDQADDRTGLLWKATGRDGRTRGGVQWTLGEITRHPTSTEMVRGDPATFLSLSVEPGETLIGGSWPCRLWRVEPLGEVLDSDLHQHKRAVLAARVVAEVEPWRALGPHGRTVAAVIDRCTHLTPTEARAATRAWDAARRAARDFAWDAARDAARYAARYAAWAAARAAAWDAAWAAATDAAVAVVVRDLISTEHHDLLTDPLVGVVGDLDALPVPAWVDQIGATP